MLNWQGNEILFSGDIESKAESALATCPLKAIVLKADASLAILATNDLEDVAYATPALAGGRLYLRTRGTLYCFGSNASSRVAR